MGVCNKCGIAIPDGTAFCPNCGTKIEAASYVADNNTYAENVQQPVYEQQMQQSQPAQQPIYSQQTSYYQQSQPVQQSQYYQAAQPQQNFGQVPYDQMQNGYSMNGYANGQYAQFGQQFQQPDLNEPMTFGEWFKTLLMLLIPVANIILLIMWAFFSKDKKSKVSFARAALAILPIILILYWIIAFMALAL